ncbi:TetR family transcriptional regulator [Stutzerimonas stutzeri]|uniref:TetR family transcriptional regulator n=1 Tax=Stutzerimonas stutzeri TaxID=316 RepID=A0A2N8T346_STUST|nr:TetR/AcrR family transcriptional regulator [Stutzerimonas stutzeri]MCQ4323968.1 TetR/AcrR family transcriptional regulator [Stutzerimonas stutzeri]PNG09167.1 TetR family transcriptional regulator [Stutzerimonas stutzeri]
MSWPTQQRDRTRTRILESAARLFALRGFEQVGIDELMADAGLTRGAFYHHFQTKAELYAEAIRYSAKAGSERLDELGAYGLGDLIEGYLRLTHAQGESMRCPLAFMATDVTRQEPKVRQAYSTALRNFVGRLEATAPAIDRQQALQTTVALIGGVVLARAVDDPHLAEELLAACRSDCYALLANPQESD